MLLTVMRFEMDDMKKEKVNAKISKILLYKKGVIRTACSKLTEVHYAC